MKRIVLIDASFACYWRHHAQEKNHRADCAEDWIAEFLRDAKPDLAVVAMDHQVNWRTKVYPDYKMQRAPRPERVQATMDSIRECSPYAVTVGSFEADDIIASYVATHGRDAQILIVANDKDLHQLVAPNVIMFDPKANKYWDVDAVQAKHGVPPRRVREVLALCGDASDNIPGVPGMGPVNAAKLVSGSKDWAEIVEFMRQGHAHNFAGLVSDTLSALTVQFAARVLRNYEIVGLRTDALGKA